VRWWVEEEGSRPNRLSSNYHALSIHQQATPRVFIYETSRYLPERPRVVPESTETTPRRFLKAFLNGGPE